MRLIALEIPDNQEELAGWLERHLVGPDLAGLVAELEAVHGRAAGGGIEEHVGRHLDAALARGLAVLPRSTLIGLLHRPRLLLELQERIFHVGGTHWNRLAREGDPGAVDRGHHRLFTTLADANRERAATDPRSPVEIPIQSRRWGARRFDLPILATAASLLFAAIAFEGGRWSAPTGPAWGWAKAGALPDNIPRAAYLTQLADSAEGWFQQRPTDSLALARRIGEFRQGCSALILADHRPLPAEERAWLVEKCRSWAIKLDSHLVGIEAGNDLVATRAEADETVRKLIAALRDRASRPA